MAYQDKRGQGLIVVAALMWVALIAGPVAAQGRVYVQDSPAAQQLLRKSSQLAEADRPAQAVRQLQQVIERYPHKLLKRSRGLYVDATEAVRRRVQAKPALREAYQRVFGAKAQRLLDQAKQGGPAAGELESLMARYPATEASLKAGLLAAGVYLERGNGDAAIGVLAPLADHPHLGKHKARYHYLNALGGLLADRDSHLTRHRKALRKLGADEQLAAVDSLSNQLDRSALTSTQADGRIDAGPRPTPAIGSKPIWTHRWLHFPEPQSENQARLIRQRESALEEYPPGLHPEVVGASVYLNARQGIQALDRVSGRVQWFHRRARPEQSNQQLDREDLIRRRILAMRRGETGIHPRGVLVTERSVYGVLGAGFNSGDEAAGRTAVTALKRADGAQRWETTAAEAGGQLDELAFYGTPHRAGDRLLVLAQRASGRASIDVFLIALDRATGEPAWQRHIASLMGGQRLGALPVQVRVAEGRVFLSGPGGMAAAVEPRSGTMQWIRVPRGAAGEDGDDEGDEDGGLFARRWQSHPKQALKLSSKPVLTEAGLLVSRSGLEQPPVLLNPRTGKPVRAISGDAWSKPGRLHAVGGDVLLVSRQHVTRFDGASLEMQWQHRLNTPLAEHGLEPAITRQFVAVLTKRGVTALDLGTGNLAMQKTLEPAGHLVAASDQLLVASRKRLHSYMGWTTARPGLEKRIEAHPTDPTPALSLAYLAEVTGHPDAVLAAADDALAALDRLAERDLNQASEQRGKVFDSLLSLARDSDELAHAVRRSLFERVARIADSPTQQIEYHLALGQLLAAMDKPEAAVDHYQTVLTQRRLAKQKLVLGGTRRRADLEARSRLRQLIAKAGRSIYRDYEDAAKQRLARLRQRGAGAEKMLELAARYPFAKAATTARVRAAERLIQAGRSNEAAIELRRAYGRAGNAKQRARIVGRLARLYLSDDRTDRARAWLEQVRRQHPDLKLKRDGKAITLDRWIDELAKAGAGAQGLAKLRLPLGKARQAGGELMRVADDASANDRVLLRDERTLTLHAGPALKRQWKAELPNQGDDADWQLRRLNQEQVVLFSPNDGGRVLVLNGQTGQIAWPMQKGKALLDDEVGDPPDRLAQAGDQDVEAALGNVRLQERGDVVVRGNVEVQLLGQRGRVQARNGERGDDSSAVRVVTTSTVIAIVGQRGRAVGLAAHTGRVLWRTQLGVESVGDVAVSPRALAVAGRHGAGGEATYLRLELLDPITGERLHKPIDQNKGATPRWVGFAGRHVVVASESEMQAYNLDRHAEPAWSRSRDDGVFYPIAWGGRHWLGIVARTSDAREIELYNPATGALLNRLNLATMGGLSQLTTPSHCHLANLKAAMAIDKNGQVAWRDAIELPGKRLRGQAATERFLVVAGHRAEADGDSTGRARLYLIERDTGRLRHTFTLPEALSDQTISRFTPVAGGVAVTTDNDTLLIPPDAAPKATNNAEQ